MISEQYFDTLGQTVDEALFFRCRTARVVLEDPGSAMGDLTREPLNYGQVRSMNFSVAWYRDRPTKRFYHVVITRLDTGRYELVTYVL